MRSSPIACARNAASAGSGSIATSGLGAELEQASCRLTRAGPDLEHVRAGAAARSARRGSRRPRPACPGRARRSPSASARRARGPPPVERLARRQSQGGGLCTQRPPTIVATTSTRSSSSGGHSTGRARGRRGRRGSRGGACRARARRPRARPGSTVVACNASSTVSACSGCHAGRSSIVRSDAGADARERVELLDRRVGAVRDDGARVPQRAERVRAVEPLGPEALGEVAVRRRVARTGRSRRRRARRSGEVLGREALRVLDPLAQAERRPARPASPRTRRAPRGSRGRRSRARRPASPRGAASRTISASSSPLVIRRPSRRASTPSASRACRP